MGSSWCGPRVSNPGVAHPQERLSRRVDSLNSLGPGRQVSTVSQALAAAAADSATSTLGPDRRFGRILIFVVDDEIVTGVDQARRHGRANFADADEGYRSINLWSHDASCWAACLSTARSECVPVSMRGAQVVSALLCGSTPPQSKLARYRLRYNRSGSAAGRVHTTGERPPSTFTDAPVTYEARSDTRKQTTSPASCDSPTRPRGMSLPRWLQ